MRLDLGLDVKDLRLDLRLDVRDLRTSLCKTSKVPEMGDRLATIDIGRKFGGCAPFLVGELGHHLTQCRLAEAYHPTKWHLDPYSRLATIDLGRKEGQGLLCRFLGRS